MVDSNINGQFVKISEINKMIECGAIVINRKKLEDYKRNTRIIKFKRGV